MEKKSSVLVVAAVVIVCVALSACKAQQCGSQASGAACGGGLCCSQWGWCGSGDPYCGDGCQSGPCTGGLGGGDQGSDVASVVSDSAFNGFLSLRTSAGCPAIGFYTRSAFLTAAAAFPGFGTTGDAAMKKREVAAFFANIAHETGSGCYREGIAKGLHFDSNSAPRSIQLTRNYNYRAARNAIGFDGIDSPNDPVISFKIALWYWMTQHSPTCHSAMLNGGQGFGATIRAINGGLECGPSGNQAQQQARVALYKSFCSTLGVDPGNNLTC